MRGGLLLCLSACFPSAGAAIARFTVAPPFWALVGNRYSVGVDDLAVGFSAMYHRLFKGAELPVAIEAMKHAFDLIVLMRGMHGMVNAGTLGAWLAEFHRALEPGGVLGIEQHRAAPGAVAEETSKQGYLPEAFVIEQVEKAGFELAGRSEINANPKDTRDHPEGVWTLPPTLRLGEKDRAKYVAIGESDRMTLKFVKVAAP